MNRSVDDYFSSSHYFGKQYIWVRQSANQQFGKIWWQAAAGPRLGKAGFNFYICELLPERHYTRAIYHTYKIANASKN